MKKTYKNPTTTVIKIETLQMTAASSLGIGEAYKSKDVVLSRDAGGIWDDELEEDFD